MEFAKVDGQGRVYLPKAVREAAGIEKETVLEVTAGEGKVILKTRRESVAESSKGIFKLKEHIEDVDEAIRKWSVQAGVRELSEIRRR